LQPEYRKHPEKLGKLLSFVRFMYVAARRGQFREQILSELMPPFNERGESPIWEDIGRKFTNLRYDEADRLSRRNKEFITSLFPEGDIYTCMLASEAREAIGQVGEDTLPVKRMLESIGFQYRDMIDPFDGGPHFWAKTSAVDPVKRTKALKPFRGSKLPKGLKEVSGMLMTVSKKGVRALQTTIEWKGNEFIFEKSLADALGADEKSQFYFLELKT
jgi:arginine N-succinyltransferase